MDQRQALISFAALSQETRLRIVRMLVIAGPDGMAAGMIADKVEVSPSNVSFHLKELERSGLIDQKREARSIIYTASYETLGGLVRFLMEDCCGGRPEICAPAAEVAACCAPAPETHLRQIGAMEGATAKPFEAS
ncbi:putative transcriptional regulator [Rhizobium leguminosarum bv. trifolii WSM2297]|uniref:Putative transcriptional regulator n=1 Tax=Rhizobium leguminosarum bv. trifolii WSM2297 TaxID=754762 RepID=J0CS68_RHILT|nr:metalloregulator ArsR/SmtB family transcription factor [Rhizobium leguminosarum]EJC82610.1 putative transcriptional regulator [Rhizobium leguminosarum bv. trifolii WSM2297]